MSARIVVVSASIGAGHDGAAAELARRLRAAGFGVNRYDFLDLLPPGTGRTLRQTYATQLRVAPRSWDWLLSALQHRRSGAGAATLAHLGGRRRMRIALNPAPAAVVSTYPLASQVLGRLRRSGALTAPVITYLTDMSVHPLWVAPGVDLHLALHEVAADQARRLGADTVAVAGAAVDPAFHPAHDPPAARAHGRARFGLPSDAPLALIVAGSWGVGDVIKSARDIARSGIAVPVTVCGRNESLRARLADRGIGVSLGWVNDMPALIRACDVVVQNAGGLTSLEAMACGVPVVSYRSLPGHGTTNAAALDQAGLAARIDTSDDLLRVLSEVLHGDLARRQAAAMAGLITGDVTTAKISALLPATQVPSPAKPLPSPADGLLAVAA